MEGSQGWCAANQGFQLLLWGSFWNQSLSLCVCVCVSACMCAHLKCPKIVSANTFPKAFFYGKEEFLKIVYILELLPYQYRYIYLILLTAAYLILSSWLMCWFPVFCCLWREHVYTWVFLVACNSMFHAREKHWETYFVKNWGAKHILDICSGQEFPCWYWHWPPNITGYHLGGKSYSSCELISPLFSMSLRKSLRRMVLSSGADVLVKLHGFPPSTINNWRESGAD